MKSLYVLSLLAGFVWAATAQDLSSFLLDPVEALLNKTFEPKLVAPFAVEKGVCTIPPLTDNFATIEGCQCECVVSWGPAAPEKPDLLAKKALNLTNFLDGLLPLGGIGGRRLQTVDAIFNFFTQIASDFQLLFPFFKQNKCKTPEALATDYLNQCDCKCPIPITSTALPLPTDGLTTAATSAIGGLTTAVTSEASGLTTALTTAG